jgi:hypothetical protein
MAATAESALKPAVPLFPEAGVKAVLREELIHAVKARAKRKGVVLPSLNDEIYVLSIRIDSLTVVELLASLDALLPFKVTESVVKAGGYESILNAVSAVSEKVHEKWKKHYSGGKK